MITALLALLLLGSLENKIPSDREIAAKIEEAIRAQLHPAAVTVVVERRSPLSTTVRRLEITISGFTADNLPFGGAPAAAAPPAAPTLDELPLPEGEALLLAGGSRKKARQIRIVTLHLACKDFVARGLPIEEMTWDLHDVRVPWHEAMAGHFTIAAAESAVGALAVSEQGVTRYLRGRPFPLQNPVIRLTPEGCRVNGAYKMLVNVPVTVTGRLVARNGAVLFLDDPTLQVTVITLPDAVTERLLKDVNPIADLNAELRLPATLTITRVVPDNGRLRVEAALAFPPPE